MTTATRALAIGIAIAACSGVTSPDSTLTLAPVYHLESLDGTAVPFTSADGEVTDSGRVKRLGGDTVLVNLFRHIPAANGAPQLGVVTVGTWRATQRGNVVALAPLIAFTFDTATIAGDTLTLRDHTAAGVQIDVYVAP